MSLVAAVARGGCTCVKYTSLGVGIRPDGAEGLLRWSVHASAVHV